MQYDNRAPIYLQVIDLIQKRLIKGEIRPGDKLPSTRMLALEYEVNPNTAARIYREMETMGLCYTQRGLGTFVTEDPAVISATKREMADILVHGFIREMTELGYSAAEITGAIEEEIKPCST